MINKRKKDKHAHEKEMKEFEYLKKEIRQQNKNNLLEKMKALEIEHNEKMKSNQQNHEKEMEIMKNELELKKMELQFKMQQLQIRMITPNNMNFMNIMNNQQFYEKQNPQNQPFNCFPYQNMNNNIPN